MSLIISWLGRYLVPNIIPFLGAAVFKILASLGFSLVVVEGVNLGFDYFVSQMSSSFGGISGDIAGILGLLGVDEAVNIVLTAHLFVIGLKGLTAKKYLPSWRMPRGAA